MALVMTDQSGMRDARTSVGLANEGMLENPKHLVDQAVKEIVIVIRSDGEGENGDVGPTSEEVVEEDKLKMEHSCVIDVNGVSAGGGEEFERVCRICQISSEVLFGKTSGTCIKEMDLIQLGCGCKDDMGIAHSHCAETWFKLKGNRVCEICGEAAKNITGIRDQMLVEEWNEVRFSGYPTSEGSEGCWRGKPYCNLLMACLVLAVIVPWFLHLTWFT